MSSAESGPYDFLTRRSSDEALARLREQHQKAADDAHARWIMHEEIVTSIMAEQTRRLCEKGSSDE